MNSFTWSSEENDWIFLGGQYNEDFNNWKVPINNGQFLQNILKDMRKTEETWSKYAGSVKFNEIHREGKPTITINSYNDQCCEHMTINGMWDVFSIIDSQNKDKEWDIFIHQSRFPLEYTKLHVKSIMEDSEADQYIVQNLTW